MSQQKETGVSPNKTNAIGSDIPTTYRRAILCAIRDLDGSLSPTLTARVLQGRRTAVVKANKLSKAPAFGVLRGATRRQVRDFIDDLAAEELVSYGLGSVYLTKAGSKWLKSRKGVPKAGKQADLTPDEEFDKLAKAATKPKAKKSKAKKPKTKARRQKAGFDAHESRLAKGIKQAGAYVTFKRYPQVAEALGVDINSQNPDDYPTMGANEFYNFAFAVIAGDRIDA